MHIGGVEGKKIVTDGDDNKIGGSSKLKAVIEKKKEVGSLKAKLCLFYLKPGPLELGLPEAAAAAGTPEGPGEGVQLMLISGGSYLLLQAAVRGW